jgi:hypothetical protein
MMDAPSSVAPAQLRELGLELKPKPGQAPATPG